MPETQKIPGLRVWQDQQTGDQNFVDIALWIQW